MYRKGSFVRPERMWPVERYIHRQEVKVRLGCTNMCHGGRQVEWRYSSTDFNLASRQMWVVRLSTLATLLPAKKLQLEAGWALELVWMFWRGDSSVASAKIWTADLPAYIPLTVLTVLPHSDMKVIQKSLLIKWDSRFGLDVYDSWRIPGRLLWRW